MPLTIRTMDLGADKTSNALDFDLLRRSMNPALGLRAIRLCLRDTDLLKTQLRAILTVVAVGCDMPFVEPGLLAWLAAQPEPLVVPSLDGQLQPFPGRYDPVLLPALEAALARGDSMRRTIKSLAPRLVGDRELSRFGKPRRLCFNVNVPGDLERAREQI